MIQVLQVNTTFGGGGAGRVAADLWEGLDAAPGAAAWFAYGRGGAPAHQRCVKVSRRPEVLLHAGLVRLTGLEGAGTAGATRRLIELIDRERFDVVHLHNLHGYWVNFAPLLQALAANGTPIVWTLHDEWAISGLRAQTMGCRHCRTGSGRCTSAYPYPRAWLPWLAGRNLSRKQEASGALPNLTLVLPAQWLVPALADTHLGTRPHRVIANGVDPRLFAPVADRAAARRARGLPSGAAVVLFIAQRDKGLADVAAVAAALRDRPVVFLGLGPDSPTAAPNVEAVGPVVDRAELATLFGLADVLLFPSPAETAPLAVLEAMACGVPVVGYDAPWMQEPVHTRAGSLTATNDRAALAAAVTAAVEDLGWRQRAGAAARARVLERFSKERHLSEHLQLYRSLLARR